MGKISASMVALSSSPSFPQASAIWPLIDANIGYPLPKSQN